MAGGQPLPRSPFKEPDARALYGLPQMLPGASCEPLAPGPGGGAGETHCALQEPHLVHHRETAIKISQYQTNRFVWNLKELRTCLTPKFSNKANVITFDLPWTRQRQLQSSRGPQTKLLTRPCLSWHTGWAARGRIDRNTSTSAHSHAASALGPRGGVTPTREGIFRYA